MKQECSVRVHDALFQMGWISGYEASSLAYWTLRLAEETEGVARYAVAHRQLREMAWSNVRPFRIREYAVTQAMSGLVAAFLKRHGERFSSKYDQTISELRRCMSAVRNMPPVDASRTELAA